MNNTMISIDKYIISHYTAFGLQKPSDLLLTRKLKTNNLDDRMPGGVDNTGGFNPDGQWLIKQVLRTVGDRSRKVPFNNLLATGVKGERFLTLVEFECKTRAPNSHQDFYWNQVRLFRDKVYNALAGINRGGIVITRYDWSDPAHPVQAGEIWFEVDPGNNSPIEDPLEDQDDPANKSIFLTYNVRWWRPVP